MSISACCGVTSSEMVLATVESSSLPAELTLNTSSTAKTLMSWRMVWVRFSRMSLLAVAFEVDQHVHAVSRPDQARPAHQVDLHPDDPIPLGNVVGRGLLRDALAQQFLFADRLAFEDLGPGAAPLDVFDFAERPLGDLLLGPGFQRTNWGVMSSPGAMSRSATMIGEVSAVSGVGPVSLLITWVTPMAATKPQPRASNSNTADLARIRSPYWTRSPRIIVDAVRFFPAKYLDAGSQLT